MKIFKECAVLHEKIGTGSGSEIVTPLRLPLISKPVGISGWKFDKTFFKLLSSYDYQICFAQNCFIEELHDKGK